MSLRRRRLALLSILGAVCFALATAAVAVAQGLPQVQGLTVTQSGSTLQAAWTTDSTFYRYQVQYGTTPGSWAGDRHTRSATISIPFAGSPVPGQTYYARVRGQTLAGIPSSGYGPWSAVATGIVCDPITTVTGVAVSPRSKTEIDVTWEPAACADGYRVQWATDAAFAQGVGEETVTAAVACASGSCGVTISGRMADTEYFVRVTALRAGQPQGSASTADTATTDPSEAGKWIDRVPGGPVAGQFVLSIFAGLMAASRAKGMRSPRREAVIAGVMGLGGCIIPALGMGNSFWMFGIPLLVMLCAVGVIFLARR